MTITTAVDHAALLRALRAAVRAVRTAPGLDTLAALSSALLAFPTESFRWNLEDGHLRVLKAVQFAEESQHFAVIDHMDDAVTDLTRMQPSWTPAYATVAMADAVQLLARCHDRRADMEEQPFDPWSRAAEAGTRLVAILLRRTDARPADTVMVRTSAEFAARMRAAVASNAVLGASQFAEEMARVWGLFRIGPRRPYRNGGAVEWTRRLGGVSYRFELVEPGWHPDHPHGRVRVFRGDLREPERSVSLTARTSRKVIDRFVSSL
ncbi:hypothetical protein OHS33_39195 (plasmid) [Streptomyces sp. NBC_00536]|uniref:hypothetical protein n=1 Tax=Streptomyces sp. NBC_00536 TaxID=2975769 RepID=UPI002E8170D5|nr:hypothetical protein [Streptomyces sp. NBC_00536]WUC84386.1 hypothetical protein OHS33_39195 [Streptomyces sp. NBC_00536]